MLAEGEAGFPGHWLSPTVEWPEETFPYLKAGKLILNRLPESETDEVEGVSFSPGNLVEGISAAPHPLAEACLLYTSREGRPSEKAVLSSRLMDRPLRPLFPKGFYNDVQVVATVLCVDPDCTPDIVAMIGSSVALSISDIPFDGPTASVLVGRVDGRFIINPTLAEREESDLHLVVSGTKDAIMMVEAGANEVPEDVVLEGILLSLIHI